MKRLPIALSILLALGACAGPRVTVVESRAPMPARHPAYLGASYDLRAAAWALERRRPDGRFMADEESIAYRETMAAVAEVERAAALEGRFPDPNARATPVDAPGPLHAAQLYLGRARAEVAREEDDGRARPSQGAAIAHIDAAMNATRAAIAAGR